MGELLALVILAISLMASISSYRSCSEQDHKQALEQERVCWEATKEKKCFSRLHAIENRIEQ